MPYFFKLDDILINDDAYKIFLYAMSDISDGCSEVKGDDQTQVIVFNLKGVQVVNAKKHISEYKNEFEYYAHHVGPGRIVASESFEYIDEKEDGFDEFEEELNTFFDKTTDAHVDDDLDLYVHVTCKSNMGSINTRGLLTETDIPLEYKIGDREEEYTQSRSSSRKRSRSSSSSSSSSSSRSKKRRRSTGGKRKSRKSRRTRKSRK